MNICKLDEGLDLELIQKIWRLNPYGKLDILAYIYFSGDGPAIPKIAYSVIVKINNTTIDECKLHESEDTLVVSEEKNARRISLFKEAQQGAILAKQKIVEMLSDEPLFDESLITCISHRRLNPEIFAPNTEVIVDLDSLVKEVVNDESCD